jgi:hypothetical protein
MKPDPGWLKAATLVGPVILFGTILLLIALAAAADVPVFAAVAGFGVAGVVVVRRRRRSHG